MRRALVTGLLAVVVSLAAAGGAPAQTGMRLSCRVGGRTTVSHISLPTAHFVFRWWYANGTTYRAPAVVWYARSLSKGKVSIRTHGHPTRAMAVEHRPDGHLVRVTAACR